MSNKAEKRGLMPKLRFPEFREAGEWVTELLGSSIEEFREKSTTQDEYEVLTSARSGLIRQREYFENDRIAERDNIGFNIVPPNYLTYRSRSDDRRFYFNENNLGITGIISTYYPVFRVLEGSNKFFLELLAHYSTIVGKYSVGTSQTVLSLNELRRIKLPIPKEPEQQKIADCLASLDDLITLEAQQLETLKTYKKALMLQLFPDEGETLPKLRFPEFRDVGEWEYLELDSYLQEYSERVPSNTDLPIYSSTRTGLKFQKDYFDNRELENNGEYGLVPEGFFVYRHMSDDGTFKFNINKTGGNIAVSKEYPVFTTRNLHSEFLLHLLNDGVGFKAFAFAQKKGGTRTRLYLKVLRTWKALLPTYPEQQKIANCLSSLDDLITAQTQKLEALKIHKKGLMQQLFPVVVEVDA